MQGRKEFTSKLFYQTSLEELVPKDNIYRKIASVLDLHFLYRKTARFYGREGQESIDPVVFFKILLVGYLNNINSDRALLQHCADSLGI
jgi:transposase